MTTASVDLLLQREVPATAPDDVLNDATVMWRFHLGERVPLSRFSDDIWEGPTEGVLAYAPQGSRQINFEKIPAEWRICAKRVLYASQRHPIRMASTPAFATLFKRHQALANFFTFLSEKGVSSATLSAQDVKGYLLHRTAEVAHLETMVSAVATLRGAAVHFAQGLLPLDLKYPFPMSKGAKTIAESLWREANGKDFQGGGDPPFEDDDLTQIMRCAYLYVLELGPHICAALERCLSIAMRYPERRKDRSQEGLCFREQVAFLSSYPWPHQDTEIREWPPRNLRDVLVHARMCTAASAISVSFAIGARRSEINSIKDSCLTKDSNGNHLLEVTYFKGKSERNGVRVKLPVDDRVVSALQVQGNLKSQIRRLMTEGNVAGASFYTDQLFVQIGYRKKKISDGSSHEDPYNLSGGMLSSNALTSILNTFKQRVVPLVDGSISFTRFRKSVARLVTLSMEGAPLILQLLFGHTSYRVTLGYMFASPMILEEVTQAYPELLAKNLRILYQGREHLMGGAAPGIRAAVLTGSEVEMSEEEFVSLGLDMMESGQMILNVIGKGMYCLKPMTSRGPCNNDTEVLLPNPGRCGPLCGHHLILGTERPRMIREIRWLASKVDSLDTSSPMRNFYRRHHDLLLKVITTT